MPSTVQQVVVLLKISENSGVWRQLGKTLLTSSEKMHCFVFQLSDSISPEHSPVESHRGELTFKQLPVLECLQSSLGLLLASTLPCAGSQVWCYLEECYPHSKEKSACLLPHFSYSCYDSWNSQILKFSLSFGFKYMRLL